MRNFTALAVLCFILFASASCTRGTSNGGSMKLTLNSNGGNGAQSLTGSLNFAVVNIQLPTGPVVREFEFEDDPIPAGQGFELTIPNVPRGSFLVQFLGIYESDGQPGKFAYGDAIAVTTGVAPEVTITTAEIGTFAKEGRVSGRYLRQAGEPAGPTGDLVMQFQPPDLSKPKMNIHPFPMVQGYFSLMVLDGAKLDYVHLPSKEVLFKGIRIDPNGNLEINGVVHSPSDALMKVELPPYFRADTGSDDVESVPPTLKWIGFFKHESVAAAEIANKKVCYANDIHEGVPGSYRSLISGTLSNPLDINLTGSANASQIRRSAGGVGDSQAALYTGASSPCSVSEVNKIVVQHALLAGDHDEGPGMSPPFKAVRPFARWDQYIAASYSSTGPTIRLDWQYLPAIDPAVVTGVVVLAKSSNGGDGGGGDRGCEDLKTKGYSEVGATNSPSQTTFNFTGPQLTSGNRYSWDFALCAYKSEASGRRYVGRPVRGGRFGGDDNVIHTGWSKSSNNLSPGGPSGDYISTLNGSEEKVYDIDSSPALYTNVAYLGSFVADPGDEVMFTIVGKNASCGVHNGEVNQPGKMGFARVIYNTGGFMKVTKGSFIDQMDTATVNANLVQTNFTLDFCELRVVRVLHYHNLNLSTTSSLQYNSVNSAFNYATSTGGGHLALRVNGTLTLGSVISVSGAGFFPGINPGNETGAGTSGPYRSAGGPNGSGGQGYVNTSGISGSGGASIGSGGAGFSGGVMTPGDGMMMGGLGKLLLGGGGGAGDGTEAGGAGGGAVFIMARETVASSSVSIEANGLNGAGSTYGGGGGGGGSVLFFSGRVLGAGSLTIRANGGSGGTSSGGAGGGGYVAAVGCTGTTPIAAQASVGVLGTNNGSNSFGAAVLFNSSNHEYLCRMLK